MTTLELLCEHLASSPITHREGYGAFKYSIKAIAPKVHCADGSTMSVQASNTHYCTPQNNEGPYTHVEVWLCGSPEAWAEYGGGDEPYAYIPVELVAAEIDRRGGFAKSHKE